MLFIEYLRTSLAFHTNQILDDSWNDVTLFMSDGVSDRDTIAQFSLPSFWNNIKVVRSNQSSQSRNHEVNIWYTNTYKSACIYIFFGRFFDYTHFIFFSSNKQNVKLQHSDYYNIGVWQIVFRKRLVHTF